MGRQFASCRLARGSDLDDVVRPRARGRHRWLTARTWGAPFGSDLRLLAGRGGIPAVHYGPGRIDLAHAADEHVSIDDVRIAARVLALVAIDVCGVA